MLLLKVGNAGLGGHPDDSKGHKQELHTKDVPEEDVLVPSDPYAKPQVDHTPGSSRIPGWNFTYASCLRSYFQSVPLWS